MSRDDQALFEAGIGLLNTGDIEGAVRTFSAVIESSDADPGLRAKALNLRGFACLKIGDVQAAAADWVRVLELATAPADEKMRARILLRRVEAAESAHQAREKLASGDVAAAIAVYRAVLDPSHHQMDRWMAAEALLEIPGLPLDVMQEAQDVVASCALGARVGRIQSPPPRGCAATLLQVCRTCILVALRQAVIGAVIGGTIGAVIWIFQRDPASIVACAFLGAVLGGLTGAGKVVVAAFEGRQL